MPSVRAQNLWFRGRERVKRDCSEQSEDWCLCSCEAGRIGRLAGEFRPLESHWKDS